MQEGRFAGVDWASEEHAACVVDARGASRLDHRAVPRAALEVHGSDEEHPLDAVQRRRQRLRPIEIADDRLSAGRLDRRDLRLGVHQPPHLATASDCLAQDPTSEHARGAGDENQLDAPEVPARRASSRRVTWA